MLFIIPRNAEPQTTVNRLPRVAMPTVLPDANYQQETSLSAVDSVVADSEPMKHETSDRAFFEELDELIEARSIRSGPKQMFMMDEFLQGAITSSEHRDRINELDAIIDNEDIANLFQDINADTDSHDYSTFEAVNPNLRLPRSSVNSQRTDKNSVRWLLFSSLTLTLRSRFRPLSNQASIRRSPACSKSTYFFRNKSSE